VIKDGMTKHILRESMKEILPESIRQRKDKIGFATPTVRLVQGEKISVLYLGLDLF